MASSGGLWGGSRNAEKGVPGGKNSAEVARRSFCGRVCGFVERVCVDAGCGAWVWAGAEGSGVQARLGWAGLGWAGLGLAGVGSGRAA